MNTPSLSFGIPKFSVLINSRDRLPILYRCLESVLTQDYPDLEILVLDDASTRYHLGDRLSAVFKDPRLHCFRVETPLGVAGGRNFLMQKASGDIFCFLDDDAEFSDEYALQHCAEIFCRYPEVGIVATKIVNFFPSGNTLYVPFGKRWLRENPDLVNREAKVSYYVGTCHMIRREVISKCQGYQPDLMFGEEELDLSYRAIQNGFEILYSPAIVVHHFPQPSVVADTAGEQRSELFYHIRNRFFLAYKYLPAVYIPVYLAVWLTRYSWQAVKSQEYRQLLLGVKAGIARIPRICRQPLSPGALRYLHQHYGRLWY